MKLSGRVALVTGSSRGIGKAIALSLAQQGANVAINYNTNEDAAIEVVKQIQTLGGQAISVKADVSVSEASDTLVNTVIEQFGVIDILVNNVGEFFFKPLNVMNHHEWHYVLNSNLSSVYYLCHAVLPKMRTRGQGRIINIGLSPTYLVRGAPNIAAYAIAKTGVLILTRSLAVEEAANNITVNCVSPGLIDNGHLPSEQKEWMQKRVPMGRLGLPEEVAEAIAFLASDSASYISGANIAVAGAWDWEDRLTNHDQDVHNLFVEDK
ncbi:SDR family NAD(P)-dependent oxidoreductase [Nostoc sp. PA-18-2419]|uniref:SDR family NAD(P)-dependent oxidoreductase n=1 Tax=Nostoc sp. PA-18-2419 TaxID=2575443 RepID=UPI0011082D26|nr:3-oxoacyl-ACP reductase family protein [Nostoc sp. PA-18-2419]